MKPVLETVLFGVIDRQHTKIINSATLTEPTVMVEYKFPITLTTPQTFPLARSFPNHTTTPSYTLHLAHELTGHCLVIFLHHGPINLAH